MAPLYAQQSDLLVYSINESQLASFDAAAIMPALYAASAYADAYFTSQYTLPLKQWDANLTAMVCHLATWRLWNKRGYNAESPEDKVIRAQYDEAKQYLKDIAEENIHPGWIDSSAGGGNEDGAGPYVYTARSRGWRNAGQPNSDLDALNEAWLNDPFFGL